MRTRYLIASVCAIAFVVALIIGAIRFEPSPATAQVVNPPVVAPIDTSNFATKTEVAAKASPSDVNAAVSALQSTVMAAMPQPATTVGPAEMVGGAVGSSTAYKRADWTPPRRSRTGTCTLNVSGVCTASWTSAFNTGETPVMFGDPVAINTVATFPISCNVTSAPTLTNVAVKCWQGQSSLVSVLGATVLPFNATLLSGTAVTVSAIPASN